MISIYLRAAVPGDQQQITRLVRAAGINPLHLHWQNFIVAEAMTHAQAELVGIGQIKPHRDGSRELASIAVAPPFQGQGLAAAIIHELLRREAGALYLYCREALGPFYTRFGFVEIPASELPPSLRSFLAVGHALSRAYSLLTGQQARLLVMRRPGMPQAALNDPPSA